MNKRQVMKALLFIAIFLFILTSVTYILRTSGTIKENFVGFYAEPEDTIDVVYIGSSPVYPCFAAPKLWGDYGITSYPLSSNVQRPIAAKYLVKEALKSQQPKLFVFELRQFTASDEIMAENMAYTRGVTDNLKYSFNRIETINAMVADPFERYTYYFDIFKYHSNWRSFILPEQLTSIFYERKHPLKGFFVSSNVVMGQRVDCSTISEKIPIPTEQEEILIDLLGYLKENDLDALFLVSPKSLTEEQQMMFNYMNEIIVEYGYSYLNMNDYYDEIGIDFTSDFYDEGSHTNALGAIKCTEFLGKYLHENYDFNDRRGDGKFESWDRAYQYWKECVDEAVTEIETKVKNGTYDKTEEF